MGQLKKLLKIKADAGGLVTGGLMTVRLDDRGGLSHTHNGCWRTYAEQTATMDDDEKVGRPKIDVVSG